MARVYVKGRYGKIPRHKPPWRGYVGRHFRAVRRRKREATLTGDAAALCILSRGGGLNVANIMQGLIA